MAQGAAAGAGEGSGIGPEGGMGGLGLEPDVCSDGKLDGSETDIDCGGSCPTKCAQGQACGDGARDCASGACANGNCAAPSCSDGVRNALETDIDCGGGKCKQCPPLAVCDVQEDCSSNACVSGRCDAELRVYYQTDTAGTTETRVRPSISLANEGTNSVDLSQVSIRYYLSTSGEDAAPATVSEQAVALSGPGGGDLTDSTHWQVVAISPTFKADAYAEVSFAGISKSLPPGEAVSLVFTLSFADSAPMTQSNDYSFDEASMMGVPYDRIPVYLNGALIYGLPPGQ